MIRLLALTSALALAGCATPGTPPQTAAVGETISIARGPCFGFCPVYTVSIDPAGLVRFNGERHTAVLGTRERQAGRAAYAALRAKLARFRPATGTTAETPCAERISDQSHQRIGWTGANGSATVLEHDRGCRSGDGQALNAILDQVPADLGIEEWALQTTRPGVGRG